MPALTEQPLLMIWRTVVISMNRQAFRRRR